MTRLITTDGRVAAAIDSLRGQYQRCIDDVEAGRAELARVAAEVPA